MKYRQRAGLVVIAAALLLVAVVAGQQTHLVAGYADSAPVPGPPAAGDCIVGPLVSPIDNGTVSVIPPAAGIVPVYPAQETRPCSGTRYGEITALISLPKTTVFKRDNEDAHPYFADPNEDDCFVAAAQYVGVTTQPVQRFWLIYLRTTVGVAGPSPRQKAAGQHWVACVVALRTPDPTATNQNPIVPQYGSSIRNALHTGQQNNQLGTCTQALDWSDELAGCREPHTLEILGYGDSGDHPVNRADIQLTCEQAVHTLTAMPDPTSAGALSIQIHIEDNSGATITAPQIAAHSNLLCGITTTGQRTLRGSLLALGQRPIPWA